jgi:glucose-6-phosphate 1-dehydrogenase
MKPEAAIKIKSFVLFGALGDLSIRKLIPAWYYLERDHMLDDSLQILGVGRQELTKSQFKEKVNDALITNVSDEYLDDDIISKLLDRIDYCCCDLQNPNSFQVLSSSLKNWSKPVA